MVLRRLSTTDQDSCMQDIHHISASNKTALIFGVTGQDGALLSRFLLDRNYKVIGVKPYSAVPDDQNIASIVAHPDFTVMYGDVMDSGSILQGLKTYEPDEIYNLSGLSHVGVSYQTPEVTAQINGVGPLRILEAIKTLGDQSRVRFYQASSSEMFGNAPEPQNEQTSFSPCSPYAVSKLYAYWMVKTYRQSYGMFASNGILFNHESALRGEHFVTQKICQSVARIAAGEMDTLWLGNLDAKRDWGHALDYVRGMWMILQHDRPDDFVLATGRSSSVRDFVNLAFQAVGKRLRWAGKGLSETAFDLKTGQKCVRVDPDLFRPSDIHILRGDASKARKQLGWVPKKDLDDLVDEMMTESLKPYGLETVKKSAALEEDMYEHSVV